MSLREAWSDYFAVDHLVSRGLLRDRRTPGDVLVEGRLSRAGEVPFGVEAIDYPPGATHHTARRPSASREVRRAV